jgi:NTP pyrophosphatase (non-canonical NTP hydrolase)
LPHLPETGDTLDALMAGQLELMELMDFRRFPRDIYFFLTADNLQKEVSEATEFFGDITKPWKENYEVDLAAIREEWIDVLFFWMQGAIALGLDPSEVFFAYFRKQAKNKERIKAKRANS